MGFSSISSLNKDLDAPFLGILHKGHAIYRMLGKFRQVFIESGNLLFDIVFK
jgi:hypothetical protein